MRFKTWPVAALGLGSLLCADRRVDAGVVAAGPGHLHAARSAEHASPRRRRQAAAAALRRQSVGHLRPRLPARRRARACTGIPRSGSPSSGRRTWRRSPSFARSPSRTTSRFDSLQAQARRVLGDVRSAVRLDAGREDLPERQLPAAGSGAAARGGPGDRPGDRGAEQRESRRAARRGHAAPRGLPRRPAIGCSGRACCSASWWRSIAVFRLRVLERRSEEQRAIAAGRRAPDAPAVAAAGRHAGGRAEEPVARAARSRGAGAHGLADGARADRADAARPATRGSARPWPNASGWSTDVPHRARSRARPAAEHARRLRPAGGARMARARLHAPVRRERRADDRRATSTRCRTGIGRASIEPSRKR